MSWSSLKRIHKIQFNFRANFAQNLPLSLGNPQNLSATLPLVETLGLSMKRILFAVIAISGIVLGTAPVRAESDIALAEYTDKSPIMRVYGQSSAPVGFIKFCAISPRDCARTSKQHARVQLTPSRWRELEEINHIVNSTVEPVTDKELYGEVERWSYPKRYGDCEDYVLLKRKLLADRGWPMNALLITVVRDEKGDGHAVLTVRTAQGDFLLDNKRKEVLVWHKLPYEYVKRQSYLNPAMWVSLEPVRRGALLNQTGVE